MRFYLLAASAGLIGLMLSSTVVAQDAVDPIEERQDRMEAVGDAAEAGGEMAKGESPFDAQVAAEVFSTMNESITGFADLFPEGSETGGETRAAPATFERPDEFRERADEFEADTAAALEAAPQTLEAFQAAFRDVSQNCRACHEDFRLPEN